MLKKRWKSLPNRWENQRLPQGKYNQLE